LIAIQGASAKKSGKPHPEAELFIFVLECRGQHVNKVHHVTTITRVAADLGEDEDWLREVASEMEIEDGVMWRIDRAPSRVAGDRALAQQSPRCRHGGN